MAVDIIAPGQNIWKQVHADDARVIVDAADYYRAFHAAALRARKYILVSGWQFDRGVKLLRGTDAVGRGKQVQLVKFLDRLCERTPSLRIYLLAWDFHMVFALEREWMQRLWFHYATNKRLVFRFDDAEAAGGSHHQKFVVIDGEQAFLGGIDLCESRWDDRAHRSENPLRRSRGRPSKPYHDLQAHLLGPQVAGVLRELFVDRWSRTAGDALTIEDQVPGPVEGLPPVDLGIRLGPGPVGISRTDCLADKRRVQEVLQLFIDAIDGRRPADLHRNAVLQQQPHLPGAGRAYAGARAPAPADRGGGERARGGAEGRDRRGAAPGQEPGTAAASGGVDRPCAGPVLQPLATAPARPNEQRTSIPSCWQWTTVFSVSVQRTSQTAAWAWTANCTSRGRRRPDRQRAFPRGASAAYASACWRSTPACRG